MNLALDLLQGAMGPLNACTIFNSATPPVAFSGGLALTYQGLGLYVPYPEGTGSGYGKSLRVILTSCNILPMDGIGTSCAFSVAKVHPGTAFWPTLAGYPYPINRQHPTAYTTSTAIPFLTGTFANVPSYVHHFYSILGASGGPPSLTPVGNPFASRDGAFVLYPGEAVLLTRTQPGTSVAEITWCEDPSLQNAYS